MPEQTVWYGWQTLTTDAAALTLVIVGGALDEPLLLGGSFATYVLGGPIVHATHGNWGRATLSLGARVGVPLLGIATGVGLEDCSGGEFCGFGGALIGGIVGLAGAVAIDSAALAREKKPLAASLIPSLRVSENETWFGVSGQF